MPEPVSIWWAGRDLRLADNPALCAAADRGHVVPVFVLDDACAALGAAAGWRLAQSMAALDADLRRRHARLVVRRGSPAQVLADLARETGADQVHLNSGLPFFHVGDDTVDALRAAGVSLVVHGGNWLLPPGRVLTGQGTAYRKFTPFWKNLRGHDIAAPLPAPAPLTCPDLPAGLDAADWGLGRAMRRGAGVLGRHHTVGEAAAAERLAEFLDAALTAYPEDRNRPDKRQGTSGLSDALAVGEISARQVWHAARGAMQRGNRGAEAFLSELAWRDFARDLWFHNPDMDRSAWNPDWARFPWRGGDSGEGAKAAQAWQRAQTGIDIVDAGMRQLYATGRMHNRVRMIVASYLTKHLLVDWRVGLAWFADTLTDWDPASNAMNWQWVAGSGPDAAPFFRIFNPDTQADKFDPKTRYRDHWLRGEGARDFAAAVPQSWPDPLARPAQPVMALAEGRARALAAYERLKG